MDDYASFHRNRVNLAMHVVLVPVFVIGVLGSAFSLVSGRLLTAGVLATLPLLSLALQGVGHRREENPPLSFRGPLDFVKRILVEQLYRFPAFVLSGAFFRAYRS